MKTFYRVELEEKDNGYWHSLVDFEFEKKEVAEEFRETIRNSTRKSRELRVTIWAGQRA
jgi:hypothetical protein